MEKLATENLFLLEFLVDDVCMDQKCTCDTPPGELCVSFQFLDNDPLDVCEADFTPNRKYGDSADIKSGKSCLFSLTPEQVEKATEVFDLVVSVFKKMQPGWLPEKICVGSALISISNLFVELIQSVEEATDSAPSAKTLKDCFNLTDSNCDSVGKIAIYIRMSCFGKLIVTQFQMNLNDKSVLFKDKGGQSLYRYKKAKKSDECKIQEQEVQQPSPMSMQMPFQPQMQPDMQMHAQMQQMQMMQQQQQPQNNPFCPSTPCFPNAGPSFAGMGGAPSGFGMFGGPPPMFDQSGMFGPPGPDLMPCSECNINNMPSGMSGCGGPQPPCFQQDSGLTPCIECGTLLDPQFDASKHESTPACPPLPDDPCGNYQEIGACMGGNALTIRVHKEKGKIEQVASEDGSCCCTPENIGAKKPKKPSTGACAPQIFEVNPGVNNQNQNLPFSFKMSGCGAPTGNNVVINPPVSTKPDGTKYTEISDPNKEVFVLRIGKKSEGVQKKANLELELCTPKGPELKPIPKKETRDCQYDPGDVKDSGGKGKGKKGKGKKGGKKGKKGKKK